VWRCFYSGVAGVLEWCYSGVTMVLQWCYSGVTVVSQWCHSGVTVVLPLHSRDSRCGDGAWQLDLGGLHFGSGGGNLHGIHRQFVMVLVIAMRQLTDSRQETDGRQTTAVTRQTTDKTADSRQALVVTSASCLRLAAFCCVSSMEARSAARKSA
jgi:hypothetical protein